MNWSLFLINAQSPTVSTQSGFLLALSLRLLPTAVIFHYCIVYIVWIQKELGRVSVFTSYGKSLSVNCGTM